jgi:hypothetical protein
MLMATREKAEAGVVGALGLFVLGVISLIVGISEQIEYNSTYVVEFGSSGYECSPGHVTFDLTDGAVLECGLKGTAPLSPVEANFPGFTKEQNEAVMALARQLGQNRLDGKDMSQIQHQVDQIAKTVPADHRPNYHKGMRIGPLWGASLAWTGAGILLAVLIGVVLYRLRR